MVYHIPLIAFNNICLLNQVYKEDLPEEAISWTFVNHTKREDKRQGSLGGIRKTVNAVQSQKQRSGSLQI